jgi:hypothetical protein
LEQAAGRRRHRQHRPQLCCGIVPERAGVFTAVQCHGISRLSLSEDGQSPPKKKFKDYTCGYLYVDFAEVQTEDGRQYLKARLQLRTF